jgi:hypothetical protein
MLTQTFRMAITAVVFFPTVGISNSRTLSAYDFNSVDLDCRSIHGSRRVSLDDLLIGGFLIVHCECKSKVTEVEVPF